MKDRKITIRGVHLYPHQKDVADTLSDWEGCRDKVISVKSSRQKGKSLLCSQILVKYAIGFKDEKGKTRVTKNFYVAPTLRQSRMMYDIVLKGLTPAGIIKKSNATDLFIELINGSTIYFKSSEMGDALRGFSCNGVTIVDEAAFQDDNTYFALIRPWVQVAHAPIVLLSTPFIRQGFFYQSYIYGMEGVNNYISFDWSSPKYKESVEQLLSAEKLEEIRQLMPEKIFRNEYLGEFCDSDGIVFSLTDAVFAEAHILPNDKLFVGIDWSNQTAGDGDDTSISIFNQDGKQVLLRYFNNVPNQTDRVYSILEPYLNQIVSCVCEINSLGEPYTQMLKDKNPLLAQKIKGFVTTNSSKNGLVVSLQNAFEKNEITLLPDSKQREQFGYFTANFNPKTRNITYGAPEGTGLHDDIPLSVMFSHEARKNGQATGNYVFGLRSSKIR